MRDLVALPISIEAFAPYGAVINSAERVDLDSQLVNLRAGALPRLSVVPVPAVDLPVRLNELERHSYSTQVFLPLDGADYLVAVAPPGSRPDATQIRAFIVGGNEGILYNAGVWHHAMRSLGRAARFGVFIFNDGTAADTEVVALSTAPRIVAAR